MLTLKNGLGSGTQQAAVLLLAQDEPGRGGQQGGKLAVILIEPHLDGVALAGDPDLEGNRIAAHGFTGWQQPALPGLDVRRQLGTVEPQIRPAAPALPMRSICQLGPCQVSTTALSGNSGRARLALFSCWAISSRCNRVITISTTTMITLFQPLRLNLNMTSLPSNWQCTEFQP